MPGPRDEPFEVTYRCGLPAGHAGAHGPSVATLKLRAFGVSRMADNERAVLVSFDRAPTDDELGDIHEALRAVEPAAPTRAELEREVFNIVHRGGLADETATRPCANCSASAGDCEGLYRLYRHPCCSWCEHPGTEGTPAASETTCTHPPGTTFCAWCGFGMPSGEPR